MIALQTRLCMLVVQTGLCMLVVQTGLCMLVVQIGLRMMVSFTSHLQGVAVYIRYTGQLSTICCRPCVLACA